MANIKDESELKKIQGQYNNLSFYKTEAGKIIVRDRQDIFIPKNKYINFHVMFPCLFMRKIL